jgi:hypothetical protein
MNAETTLVWVAAAITVAMVIQVALMVMTAAASLRMRRQVKQFIVNAEPVIAKIGPVADSTQLVIADVRKYAAEISVKSNELLDLTKAQLGRVDEVMAEATVRTRKQMDRIEMVMDDTVNRFQETTSLLQSGVVRPLRQLNALTSGVRAAFSVLAGARRTTVEQATHDEEMFI